MSNNDGRKNTKVPNVNKKSKSITLTKNGIKTSRDFAGLMSALITDLIEGSISAGTGNAVCNAGGKLLKVIEMEYRYGKRSGASNRILQLT